MRNAYYNSLVLARDAEDIRTIAFPNISTGIYSFPKDNAAGIAIRTVREFTGAYPYALAELTFVCFDDENYNIYKRMI